MKTQQIDIGRLKSLSFGDRLMVKKVKDVEFWVEKNVDPVDGFADFRIYARSNKQQQTQTLAYHWDEEGVLHVVNHFTTHGFNYDYKFVLEV